VSNEEGEEDLGLNYQQLLEGFYAHTGMGSLEKISQEGDWTESERQLVAGGMDIPLVPLGMEDSPWILFGDEGLRSQASRFGAELGMSIFPRSSL